MIINSRQSLCWKLLLLTLYFVVPAFGEDKSVTHLNDEVYDQVAFLPGRVATNSIGESRSFLIDKYRRTWITDTKPYKNGYITVGGIIYNVRNGNVVGGDSVTKGLIQVVVPDGQKDYLFTRISEYKKGDSSTSKHSIRLYQSTGSIRINWEKPFVKTICDATIALKHSLVIAANASRVYSSSAKAMANGYSLYALSLDTGDIKWKTDWRTHPQLSNDLKELSDQGRGQGPGFLQVRVEGDEIRVKPKDHFELVFRIGDGKPITRPPGHLQSGLHTRITKNDNGNRLAIYKDGKTLWSKHFFGGLQTARPSDDQIATATLEAPTSIRENGLRGPVVRVFELKTGKLLSENNLGLKFGSGVYDPRRKLLQNHLLLLNVKPKFMGGGKGFVYQNGVLDVYSIHPFKKIHSIFKIRGDSLIVDGDTVLIGDTVINWKEGYVVGTRNEKTDDGEHEIKLIGKDHLVTGPKFLGGKWGVHLWQKRRSSN